MALTARIRKRYGRFLLDVDFTAGAGEPLALVGVSGGGKSTALRCVAGIDRPDWGHIELDGRVLFDSERGIDLPPQRRRVGYLFQQYALFPEMTVEQNILACLRRLDRAQRRTRAAELIARMRLEGTEQLRPRQLSGGQQQRAALARILASEPQAILLDEPLSALDSHLRWQLELELQELLQQFPGPAVWVSHDLGEVCRTCRKVCALAEGRSSEVKDMKAWMKDPVSAGAARLAGYRNFVPVRPGPGEGTVSVPDWDLVLGAAMPWRAGATTLVFRANRVRLAEEGAANAFLCRIVRAAEDVEAVLAVLRPVGAAADAPPLQMALDKAEWAALADRETVRVAVQPEDLVLLE